VPGQVLILSECKIALALIERRENPKLRSTPESRANRRLIGGKAYFMLADNPSRTMDWVMFLFNE
jgi:hypothetical protein